MEATFRQQTEQRVSRPFDPDDVDAASEAG
jgi:hypothetical protein